MDYIDEMARSYALFRTIHPAVLSSLLEEAGLNATSRVLEVGCGCGNYVRALSASAGCAVSGLDPSEDMLEQARRLGSVAVLHRGRAEEVGRIYAGETFDLVLSVDVIHHVRDISAYFAGARSVLARGGRICTVTDSESIIRARCPLSAYWPETVTCELRRYPPMERLMQELRAAGFSDVFTLTVFGEYRLWSAEAYERKSFSSLHLIQPHEFERGLGRLKSDLSKGPIIANSAYALLWGTNG